MSSENNDRQRPAEEIKRKGIPTGKHEALISFAEYMDSIDISLTQGARYSGQTKNGKRFGFGTQLWPDGSKFEGNWQDDKGNGKGKFWHANGDYFEGQWENDHANGYGIYVHHNGDCYKGYWKDNL